jgi:outer membrane protein TolC
MNKIIILAGVLFISTWTFGQAQEPLSFSLEQARNYAVEHSYFTQKAVLDQEMADRKMKEVTAIGLPQVSGTADFKNFIDIPTSIVPDFSNPGSGNQIPLQFGTDFNASAGLSVNQLIFNGSYIVGLQAAKAYREMAEKQVVKTERDIKNDVTIAYGNVIVSEENMKTLKGNKDYLEQTLTETQALYEAGFGQEQDVDQLTILVQTAKIQYDRAERLVEIFRNVLKFQMGLESTTSIVLTDNLDVLVQYGNDSSIVTQPFDVNANIDYTIAVNNQELQYLNFKNKKAEFLPTLGAFYNYQQTYQNNDLSWNNNNWFPTSLWGLQLNVPIFSSGQRIHVKKQAEMNWQKSEIDTKMAEQQLMVDFLTRKSQYQFTVDQYKNTKDNLDLVQRIVNRETIKYQEGMSSSLNLANTQIQFFQIQANYIQSIVEMITARSEMDKILSNF